MGEKMNQKNKSGIGGKACALLLAVLMIILLTVPTSAAVFQSPSRAIAIVFDNSGSMYYASNATAWCRATYAIEVFASMMNDGDVLEVYPMYEVEVDGNTYNDNNPVRITNKTSSIIRSMYTPKAAATPIETIDRAFSGVTAVTADEKWLIVLTDGDEFYENGKGLGTGDATKAALTKRLSEYNKTVNVMYLGIGTSAAQPEINGNKKHYTTAAKNTENVLAELTTMCNNIFGRDELKNNGKAISFDLPMSKLIVFVQGDNISNVEVKNSEGKSVGEVVSFYNPRYGEKGSGNYPIKIDKSLQGSIITYANCEKGDYTITYDGSMSSISVYFEPDVDLSVVLKNPEGGVISPDAAYEGTYTVSYHMVDKYGQPTDSKLLGSTNYSFTYNISGTEYEYSANTAGEFALEKDLTEGDSLRISADVRYLSGYEIHKNHEDLLPGFSNPIKVVADNTRLKLKLTANQNYFQVSKLESAKPMRAKAILAGKALTAEEMQKAQFSVNIADKKGNVLDASCYEVETLPNESAWEIKLKDSSVLSNGRYTVQASIVMRNHSNEEVTAADTERITVSTFPKWLVPAAIALGILILLLLIWMFMNMKVLPKGATFINTKFMVDGDSISGNATVRFSGAGKRKGTITITSPYVSGDSSAMCSLSMKIEAVSPRRLKSNKRAISITSISVIPGNGKIQSVTTGTSQFKWFPDVQKYAKVGAKPNTKISVKVGSQARYSISGETISGKSISLSGQLKHR